MQIVYKYKIAKKLQPIWEKVVKKYFAVRMLGDDENDGSCDIAREAIEVDSIFYI